MNPWYPLKTPLVLASISPRRKNLLTGLNIPLIIHPSGVEENGFEGTPEAVVTRWATRKAESVAPEYPDHIVLGADTMVFLDGKPLGKPEDEKEAIEMLSALSGRTHSVFGGVFVLAGERRSVFHEETRVFFRDLTLNEIRYYVSTGEPMDKAGSYGAQGSGGVFVRKIRGCWYNVVGLPLPRVITELRALVE